MTSPFSLATFQQPDYDTGSLVSLLSEQARDARDGESASAAANVHSNSTAAVFDPQALTQSLESAIYALLPLREKVAARTNDCDTTVKHAERDYTSKLAELKANFQAVSTSFSSLESRISEVGRTAIKIGQSARLACVHLRLSLGRRPTRVDRPLEAASSGSSRYHYILL
jgi:hypothetical protein